MKRLALLCVIGCGQKATGVDHARIEPDKSPPGLTACGGSLSLLGDWERETSGELVAAGAVASVERLEHGIRVMLEDKRSFVIGVARELSDPVAIGDRVDVAIRCQPVGRDVIGCMGSVSANGKLVAFNTKPDGWTIERGPLLQRSPHKNYGATSTYGLRFAVGGAKATTPLRGCVELRTADGVFRVSGGEVEHADPRAPDSADTLYFDGIRLP
ncbi:MAG TPA: hypothetical protein VIU61_17145 [Kofleriaceae bacterium]